MSAHPERAAGFTMEKPRQGVMVLSAAHSHAGCAIVYEVDPTADHEALTCPCTCHKTMAEMLQLLATWPDVVAVVEEDSIVVTQVHESPPLEPDAK